MSYPANYLDHRLSGRFPLTFGNKLLHSRVALVVNEVVNERRAETDGVSQETPLVIDHDVGDVKRL